jgi:hypothetical protein
LIYVLINALGVYIIPLIVIGIFNRKLLTSIRLLEQRSAEYNAPLPTKQGKFKRISQKIKKHVIEIKIKSKSVFHILIIISLEIMFVSLLIFFHLSFISNFSICLNRVWISFYLYINIILIFFIGITIMLLATTLMLLVFRSPSAIVSIMWLISAKMFINEKPPFRLRKFHSIANLCATLNAATTFILFIVYGTKFRSEFTRIYCSILHKIKKPKRKTRQEQQQMKQLVSNNNNNNNNTENDNEQHINDIKTTVNLLNGNLYVQSSKYNNSAVTSTPSGSSTSFSPMKHPINKPRRQQFSCDEEYDLIMNHNKNIHISPQQHQVTTGEDENDMKSVLSTESYFDWFKNCISCH